MNKVRKVGLLSLLLALLLSLASPWAAVAQEPERGILLTADFPSVSIEQGFTAWFDVKVANLGEVGERIDLVVNAPEGWEAEFTDRRYTVRSLYLGPGEDTSEGTRKLEFKATPPSEAEGGDYQILLKAVTEDGLYESELEITIGLAWTGGSTIEGVTVTSDYPILRGPSGSSFEFRVTLKNDGREERIFDLSYQVPPRWDGAFETTLGAKKQISSLSLKEGSANSVKGIFTPPADVSAGEYPLLVTASSDDISDTLALQVVITGTYEMALATSKTLRGGRLSTEATAGREKPVSIFVFNTGSADIEGLNLWASAPEDWEVEFNPQRVTSLAANDFQQVEVSIKPAGKTIAGDYMVTLGARSAQVSETLDLRVTVGASTLWGWMGIAIVVVVIAALGGIFWRVGRR